MYQTQDSLPGGATVIRVGKETMPRKAVIDMSEGNVLMSEKHQRPKTYFMPMYGTTTINLSVDNQTPPAMPVQAALQPAPEPVSPPPPPATLDIPIYSRPTIQRSESEDLESAAAPRPPRERALSMDQQLMNMRLHDSEEQVSPRWEADSALGSMQEDSDALSYSGHSDEPEEDAGHSRVAVLHEGNYAVMLQVECESEAGADHAKTREMMQTVARACAQHFRKKNEQNATMNPTKVGNLPWSSGSRLQKYLDDVSAEVGESVAVVMATCRQASEKMFVGTYMHNEICNEKGCAIGKQGVIVALRKKNKYAPAEEFSDQLCQHVIVARPRLLGSEPQALKDAPAHRHLLKQKFAYDVTVTTAEAARRCFIEIADFVYCR